MNRMKKTLLIVDDNDVILKLLKAYFERNYHVHIATDGVEAISLLFEGIMPDLIICDLNMDNINGYELVKHLSTSRLYKNIPVIILSGSPERDSKPLEEAFVIETIVNKPFDPMSLSNIVKETLLKNDYRAINSKYPILRRLN